MFRPMLISTFFTSWTRRGPRSSISFSCGSRKAGPPQLKAIDFAVSGSTSGTPTAPVEVVGAEPAGPAPAGPGQAVLDQLRPMMREVVLSGTATALSGRGEVYGKTGTAEFGTNTPPDSHGWFVGYQLGCPQGDIAFAVLVEAAVRNTILQLRGIDTYAEFIERHHRAMGKSD